MLNVVENSFFCISQGNAATIVGEVGIFIFFPVSSFFQDVAYQTLLKPVNFHRVIQQIRVSK